MPWTDIYSDFTRLQTLCVFLHVYVLIGSFIYPEQHSHTHRVKINERHSETRVMGPEKSYTPEAMFHLQSFMLSHVQVCVYLHVLKCGCRCQEAFSMSLGIILRDIHFLINPYFSDSDRLAGQHQESFYLYLHSQY